MVTCSIFSTVNEIPVQTPPKPSQSDKQKHQGGLNIWVLIKIIPETYHSGMTTSYFINAIIKQIKAHLVICKTNKYNQIWVRSTKDA